VRIPTAVCDPLSEQEEVRDGQESAKSRVTESPEQDSRETVQTMSSWTGHSASQELGNLVCKVRDEIVI